MKVHRVLADAAYLLLNNVFSDGRVLDRGLASSFAANPKWGKRDRAFLAETVFEVVRWRRALAFVSNAEDVGSLCAAQWVRMGLELPDWLGISGSETEAMKLREKQLAGQPRAIRESIPDWLDQVGSVEIGNDWDAEIAALNRRAPVTLRVNRLRCSVDDARAWLGSHGVESEIVEGVPDALRLPPGRLLPKPLKMDGRVEIQDAGSQCIVPLLDPQPGESILDACAGGGGKSLQIAAAMENRGTLVAMDVIPEKLKELERRSKRAGATGLQTRLADPDCLSTEWEGQFDRVLIDSPCSGLGTLRRQPDLKWRLHPEGMEQIIRTQTEIMDRYSRAVKVNGIVVYATCSILPSENRKLVDQFCRGGAFRLVEDRTISPALTGFDGFYAAVIKRLI